MRITRRIICAIYSCENWGEFIDRLRHANATQLLILMDTTGNSQENFPDVPFLLKQCKCFLLS